jgi:predicted GNAT family acetyltransferase
MAAVVSHVISAGVAPVVSLYVNEWNTAARAAYARVGFEQTATFATLMF